MKILFYLLIFSFSISFHSCKKEENSLKVTYTKEKASNQDKGIAIAPTPFSLAVYPNPFLTSTTIEFFSDSNEEISVMLKSSDGRFKKIENSGSRLILDFSSEPKGVYYLEVKSGDIVVPKQLIKLGE